MHPVEYITCRVCTGNYSIVSISYRYKEEEDRQQGGKSLWVSLNGGWKEMNIIA